jgi:hypothetical protein
MHRNLTITIADDVYQGLHHRVGRGRISGFIESLVRPHVVDRDNLEPGYRAMADDLVREQEARDWLEAPDRELA